MNIKESDWKVFKEIKEKAIDTSLKTNRPKYPGTQKDATPGIFQQPL